MSLPSSFSRRAWILVLLVALGFVAAVDFARIERVQSLSRLGAEDARPDAKSSTGWAEGKRWLILPDPVSQAYESIQLTQQMLSRGEWRIRQIDYENSPTGRPVYTASPYRWWVATLAGIDHAVAGRPLGQSVERAALLADPLLHLLLLAAIGLLVARWFGAGTASLLVIGVATVFPFASAFAPAVPTDHGLTEICLFLSLLVLVADTCRARNSRAAYFFAGAMGGLALWLSVTAAAPVLLSTAAGGLLAAVLWRRAATPAAADPSAVPPWRAWGFGGAAACVCGYVIEYVPAHVGWDLRVNHPLYGLAWLGFAELLQRLARRARTGSGAMTRADWIVALAAIAACASVPIALLSVKDWQFISGDLFSTRLSNFPGSPVAGSFAEWLNDSPAKAPLFATLLPVLLLAPALWRLLRRDTAAPVRRAIALSVVPTVVALALSFHHLRWWTTFDAVVLVVLAATMADAGRAIRWVSSSLLVAASGVALFELLPGPALNPQQPDLARNEVRAFYERGLAHWIVDHAGAGPTTVLASPLCTSSFCFYGSLRGLGTAGWQNRDGLSSSYRLASSSRTDETLSLLNKYGVNYIVLPSWDTALETMASLGVEQATDSFISALHQTAGAVFPWLHPLPYNPPVVAGFEDAAVLLFQVTDEANPAVVRSRTVEYLLEMHRMDQATAASSWLQRYPSDVGAQVALAQYAKAAGNDEEFAKVFKSIVSYVQVGADRRLPWDRRVSLAVVLALGGKEDLARVQVERCLGLLNEKRVRELTTGSLYHLMVLVRHFDLKISDPKVRELALSLLPAELRERL